MSFLRLVIMETDISRRKIDLFVPVRQVKCDIVGSEKTCRGIWDGIDTTLVNRKTKTKLWMPDYLAECHLLRQDGGAVPG